MSHHALLCRIDSVQDFSLNLENYIDSEVCNQYFVKFGIEDVRDLIVKAHGRPLTKNTQCLVVRADFITLEAQNALLKLIEEPPLSTYFVFVVPNDLSMIPTLMSRFSSYNYDVKGEVKQNEVFDFFLKQSYKERFLVIEQATKVKDIDWQRAIKQGLITYLKQNKNVNQLSELEYIARLLLTRGASNKMLLDNLALLLKVHTKR